MKTLEEVIRAAAKSGNLNRVSLSFCDDGEWEATYRGALDKDFRFLKHKDPACALRAALTGRAGDLPPPDAPELLAKPPRGGKTSPPAPAPHAPPTPHVDDDIFGDI